MPNYRRINIPGGDYFFTVNILEGDKYEFGLPLANEDTEPFYEHIYNHVFEWFDDQIERYKNGDNYSTREIGFDFANDDDEVLA